MIPRAYRIAVVSTCLLLASATAFAAESEWVKMGPDGKLTYKTTPKGDKVMDFSHAGYMGGGVALPEVPVKLTVEPAGTGDDTARIQEAINKVAEMPLEGKFRGAVQLAAGDFHCSEMLSIPTGGVVLRGSGSGLDGKPATTIHMHGGNHTAIAFGRGRGRQQAASQPAGEFAEATTKFTDEYVPSGAIDFSVESAQGFAVGDTVEIRRPVTAAWVEFMDMHKMTRGGRPQTWMRAGSTTNASRRIAAIDGNKITLDVPLSDSYDAKYVNPPGVQVLKVRPASRLTHSGVEHLHIKAPPMEMSYQQAPYTAMRINGEDCWARNIKIEETMNSVSVGGRRITLQEVAIYRTVPNLGASKPAEFAPNADQVLLDRCSGNGDNIWHVATGGGNAGPIVLLNCRFMGTGRTEGHQRWTTGMLMDNVHVPEGGIDYRDRGSMGSGHGWASGWSVAWNCVAKNYIVQQTPGTINWLIGSKGENIPTPRPFNTEPPLPLGTTDSHGVPVEPHSLYLAQLAERLGPQAVENIGYKVGEPLTPPEVPAIRRAHGEADIDPQLGQNFAAFKLANVRGVRDNDRRFAGERALDTDPDTYWLTPAGVNQGSLEVDLEDPQWINTVEIQEAAAFGPRVKSYRFDAMQDSDWVKCSEGTTIGERKIDRFPKVFAWKVRLIISEASDSPAISKFGLYLDNTNSAAAAN